jgi:hypothetical protein
MLTGFFTDVDAKSRQLQIYRTRIFYSFYRDFSISTLQERRTELLAPLLKEESLSLQRKWHLLVELRDYGA